MPVIFISYSHKDEPEKPIEGEVKWLTYIQSHLAPAVSEGVFTTWDDRKIPGGSLWKRDIEKQLDTCDVCILLVSRHSLSSSFIRDVEIKAMLERRKSEGAYIYPIIVSPCFMNSAVWLKEMNLRPRDGQPLSGFSQHDRDTKMVSIVEEIAQIVENIKVASLKSRSSARRSSTLGNTPDLVDIVHLSEQTRKNIPSNVHKSDPTKQTPRRDTKDCSTPDENSLPVINIRSGDYATRSINLTRLPATAYKKLVGRDEELLLLDAAWTRGGTNILSLVAWGGAGKTALVNEWLRRLQNENFRGANIVLGWSFYSQGTKERSTSAEEFLNWALEQLLVNSIPTAATAKGEILAEVMAARRVLLILDGVEPLQYGPGPQEGQLKDQGLRALLRRFAVVPPATSHGLIILTSRIAVRDIERWRGGPAPVVDLGQLSEGAGAALLRDNGVQGADSDLLNAAQEFEGHALALSLVAGFLVDQYGGDVRQRDRIGKLVRSTDEIGHLHAHRVMEAYASEFLVDEPVLASIMNLVGLFDRLASPDCLRALRSEPTIEGLNEHLTSLTDQGWLDAVKSLRSVRLVDPEDPSVPGSLDAHPLVRDWFGDRLKRTNEKAWRAAHARLYEHLRDYTKEGPAPTLEGLGPLYQAIAHGCRSGRHQEALNDIYINRICRRHPDGGIEDYSLRKLGAVGSELSAISWFFELPFEVPVSILQPADRLWILNRAGSLLRAQGRFVEALPAIRATVDMPALENNWWNAAISASNLTEAELAVGNVVAAIGAASRASEYSDRSGETFRIIAARASLAVSLFFAGRIGDAEHLFVGAEHRQQARQPSNPKLDSVDGFRYCDLLIQVQKWSTALGRAEETVLNARANGWLLATALDDLTIGRAYLGISLDKIDEKPTVLLSRNYAESAREQLDDALGGLRAANDMQFLPIGMLTRAIFFRLTGNWDGAARDLDEVEEIAEPGPMRLHLCDMALERVRLAFAKVEVFAPLNGILEKDNPPKPEAPGAEMIARLKQEAEKQIKIADNYIQTCGYHRRDEELAELQAVLRGEKTFASLPPRV